MAPARKKSAPKISPKPIKAFISYSNRDRALCETLVTHLQPLVSEGRLVLNSDLSLKAGDAWDTELTRMLSESAIVLFLVSPDSLKSDFVRREVELTLSQPSKVIVPILLRPCDWYGSPLARFTALPTGAKPVTTWPDRDAAFLDIVDGLWLVLASFDRAEEREELPAKHEGRVKQITVTSDGQRIVSVGVDEVAIVWDAITLRPSGALSDILSVAVSPDGKQMATVLRDMDLGIWDLTSFRKLPGLALEEPATAVAFSQDGDSLVSASSKGIVRRWHLKASASDAMIPLGTPVKTLVWLPMTDSVVVVGANTWFIWDMPSNLGKFRFLGVIEGLCALPDGNRVITWGPEGFQIRNVSDGEVASAVSAASVEAVIALPNGRHAVSAHPDGLKLWDLTNGTLIRSMDTGNERPTALAVTPDGARAIWGSEQGAIFSWPTDLSFSRALPTGRDRLRLAYLAVLASPELWRILETWDESALSGIGAQLNYPAEDDVLERLAADYPGASLPPLWAAWMETLHKSKLGEPPKAS